MDLKGKVKSWIENAEYDLRTAEIMHDSARYVYTAFMCQQSLEKAIKGIYLQNNNAEAPRSHNLSYLIGLLNCDLQKEHISLPAKPYHIISRGASGMIDTPRIGGVCATGECEKNQDSVLTQQGDNHALLVLCDGMGKQMNSERAAAIVINTMDASYKRTALHPGISHFNLQGPLRSAHERIVGLNNGHSIGMGTTVVAALIEGSRIKELTHAGDSRAYLARNGQLSLLTLDDSWARFMTGYGDIPCPLSPEDTAKFHEATRQHRSSAITKAIGIEKERDNDDPPQSIFPLASLKNYGLQSGDTFILCSDGLHNYITFTEMARVLQDTNSLSPLEIARGLTGSAYEHKLDLTRENYSRAMEQYRRLVPTWFISQLDTAITKGTLYNYNKLLAKNKGPLERINVTEGYSLHKLLSKVVASDNISILIYKH
jgi:serine/threonine protein phosphatase PrpC